jgi:CheY-like chemotaxis protein
VVLRPRGVCAVPSTTDLISRIVRKSKPANYRSVLLVDSRDQSRITTKWFLTSFGYVVDSVRNVEEALVLFKMKVFDVIVTHDLMPDMSGDEMAQLVKLRSPSTPVILYAGAQRGEFTSCADLVLQRPIHLLSLRDAIESLVDPGARQTPGT